MAKSKTNTTETKVASVAATEQTTPEKVEQVEEQKQASAEASVEAQDYDYVVVQRFRDKNSPEDNPKFYEVGDTVNKFGEERLNDLMSRSSRPLVERRPKQ